MSDNKRKIIVESINIPNNPFQSGKRIIFMENESEDESQKTDFRVLINPGPIYESRITIVKPNENDEKSVINIDLKREDMETLRDILCKALSNEHVEQDSYEIAEELINSPKVLA